MTGQTALQQWTAPIKCTSMTSLKSSISIFAKLLSRKMPALLIKISTRPHCAMVSATIACTAEKSVTEAPLAIASPPAARISSTTACAAESDEPEPSRAPPKSLTTTLAPRAASARACSRPKPPPAPVTIATRPLKSSVICLPLLVVIELLVDDMYNTPYRIASAVLLEQVCIGCSTRLHPIYANFFCIMMAPPIAGSNSYVAKP